MKFFQASILLRSPTRTDKQPHINFRQENSIFHLSDGSQIFFIQLLLVKRDFPSFMSGLICVAWRTRHNLNPLLLLDLLSLLRFSTLSAVKLGRCGSGDYSEVETQVWDKRIRCVENLEEPFDSWSSSWYFRDLGLKWSLPGELVCHQISGEGRRKMNHNQFAPSIFFNRFRRLPIRG